MDELSVDSYFVVSGFRVLVIHKFGLKHSTYKDTFHVVIMWSDGNCIWHVGHRPMGIDGPISPGRRHDYAHDGPKPNVREACGGH